MSKISYTSKKYVWCNLAIIVASLIGNSINIPHNNNKNSDCVLEYLYMCIIFIYYPV